MTHSTFKFYASAACCGFGIGFFGLGVALGGLSPIFLIPAILLTVGGYVWQWHVGEPGRQ